MSMSRPGRSSCTWCCGRDLGDLRRRQGRDHGRPDRRHRVDQREVALVVAESSDPHRGRGPPAFGPVGERCLARSPRTGSVGSVRCRSASGDVELDEVDRIDATTASGDVRVNSVKGDAGFVTSSGDVNVGQMAGRLTAQLASGDLAATQVGAGLQVARHRATCASADATAPTSRSRPSRAASGWAFQRASASSPRSRR